MSFLKATAVMEQFNKEKRAGITTWKIQKNYDEDFFIVVGQINYKTENGKTVNITE